MYIIWGNDENIAIIGISNNYYIDTTFHSPPEFSQLLIFIYKDKITEFKIPGLYVLMNRKFKNFMKLYLTI